MEVKKYRGGGMSSDPRASKLAKMMQAYRNGGYVYAQNGGQVPTGSSSPQSMTREEYLAFPKNWVTAFGLDKDYAAEHTPEETANWIKTMEEQVGPKMEQAWSEFMSTKGGQAFKLPLTGLEYTRPSNLSWLKDENFGSYILPKESTRPGGYYFETRQPTADIYYGMMEPGVQREFMETYKPDDEFSGLSPERAATREEMLNRFGTPFQRGAEQTLIEEAIRARLRAKEAGVL